MKKVNLLIFNLDAESPQYKTLVERFGEEESVHFETIRFYKEANDFIKISKNAVFLFKVENKAEFVQSMAILKANIALIKKGLLKPVCLLGVNSNKLERIFFKYGCTDLLDISVYPKTLCVKTDLWTKSVASQLIEPEDFMSLGQREQDFSSSEEELESELSALVNDLDESVTESHEEDLELDSLMEELDDEDFSFSQDDVERDDNILSFETTEESVPELLQYITESGEVGHVNLESGSLDLQMDWGMGEKATCTFESFDEDQMVLEVPDKFEQNDDQTLKVWVKFIYNKCRIEIELSGTIADIEEVDGQKYLTVDFSSTQQENLAYFMTLLQKRQASINDFIALARGL